MLRITAVLLAISTLLPLNSALAGCGGAPSVNAAQVSDLYNRYLGRPGNATDINAWVDQSTCNLSYSQLQFGFCQSPEAQQNIQSFAQQTLQRPVTHDEFQSFLSMNCNSSFADVQNAIRSQVVAPSQPQVIAVAGPNGPVASGNPFPHRGRRYRHYRAQSCDVSTAQCNLACNGTDANCYTSCAQQRQSCLANLGNQSQPGSGFIEPQIGFGWYGGQIGGYSNPTVISYSAGSVGSTASLTNPILGSSGGSLFNTSDSSSSPYWGTGTLVNTTAASVSTSSGSLINDSLFNVFNQ